MMKKFPNSPIGADKPYEGTDNLRPESKATVEFLKYELPYDPAMESWGSGNN